MPSQPTASSAAPTGWQRISRERPPYDPDALLLAEPAESRLIYASRKGLWALGADRAWRKLPVQLASLASRTGGHIVGWTDDKGRAVIGRFDRDGLVVSRLNAPGELDQYSFAQPLPGEDYDDVASAVAFNEDGVVHLVVAPTMAMTSVTLKLVADELIVVGPAPFLEKIAHDPVARRTLGFEKSVVYRFDGRGWLPLASVGDAVKTRYWRAVLLGLAWHPGLGALVTFVAGSHRDVTLYRVDSATGAGTPVAPPIRLGRYRPGGQVAVTSDGTVAFVGGLDFDALGYGSTETYLSQSGRPDMGSDWGDEPPPMGAHDTLVTTEDRLLKIDHTRLQIHAADGGAWPLVAQLLEPYSEILQREATGVDLILSSAGRSGTQPDVAATA